MSINSITLRQLRYFAVIGRELSYRRTAELLFVSQPAISLAIKQLERELGIQLLIRDTRSVALTNAGQVWLPKVEELLERADALVDEMSRWSDGRRDSLRMGYLIGTGSYLLGRLVASFESGQSQSSVETIEFDFSDPTAGLAAGKVDVGLIRPPVTLPGCEMVLVEEESWVTCLPRNHRLAGRQSLNIHELLDEPIIAAPESAGVWRDYWIASSAREHTPANVAAVVATNEAEFTEVSRGIGISFTTSGASQYYQRPGIVFIPIVDMEPVYVALAWRRSKLTGAAASFVAHVRDAVAASDKPFLSTDTKSLFPSGEPS